MFPALHKKFLIITPSLASAFPEATSTITTSASSPSSTSLPVSLQALIPECAQSCVESILFDEWPLGCASSGDLECLCSRYSTTGLTLGEAAYACAVTSCASSTPDLASTYSICSGQHGAVVATHSTLTFTAHITSIADTTAETASSTSIRSNTTSTRLSSSTSSSRSSSSRTTLDSSTTPASSASSTSSVPSSTSSQAPASSSAAAAAAAGSSSNDGNGLSTAQIVGISVASVSAVVLAVGVLFLMACLRKRDRKKQEEVSEKQGRSMFALTPPSHDNVAMSPSALEQFPSPPRNRKDPRNGAGVGTGISIPQVRVDAASPPRQRAPTPLENIGLAITEDSPIASPASFSSNRTVSQLLPDKPEPVMPRQPDAVPKSPVPTSAPFIAKRKKPSQRDSSMTQDTVFEDTAFEEDTAVRKSMYPAKAVSVPPRKQQPPPIAPPVRPYRPPPSFAQEYTASPDTTRQPSLSLTIPPQGRQYPRQPTPSPPPIPSPLRIARPPNVAKPPIPLYYHRPAAAVLPSATDAHSSGSSGSTKFTGTNSTASSSYIPAYYTSPPTSILQTPPESYGGHGTSAAFSNNGPVPQTQSTSWSPQRQAQTTSPPHATTSTTQNRLPPQPQPAFAHPGPSTTGHQQRTTQQGTQANPPALRQWYPPPAPVAAVPANGHQQPAFPPPYRQHTSAGSTSLAQPPAAAKSQGSQYIPYSVPTAYARPPLPPQPQSPSRPPRGNARDARAAGQQTATTRPPLIKGDRVQRSTSSASMTSFESASPDDPSPPEDEETAAKQLGPDHHPQHHRRQKSADTGSHRRHNHPVQQMSGGRLTPNANEADEDDADADRSPISDIRYPKVPRASNQAVPRSSPNAGPRTATPSPRVNQQGDASPSVANSPQGLLARRRGEGNGLLIDSGSGTPTKKGSRSPRTPENRIIGGGGGGDEEKDQARKSSAALPPAEREVGDATIATPTWVPRLTPTRRGDDLYLAVAYASKEGIP